MSFYAYPTYKDSGDEWIGAIPDHWSASALKRVFKIEGGSTPKSDEINWDGDIAWVTPADLSGLSSLFLGATKRTITSQGLASCGTTLLPVGSLILSTRAPIGSLAISLISMCTNQGCKGLVPNASASSAYFAYVLLTAKSELNNHGRGSTFLEISGDELGRFSVPTPPFEEQIQIVCFLDHETARIDALIEEQQRLIDLLKEKRGAVISHAVTKGVDPAVPMKDSGVEWLGEVPVHWEIGGLTRFIGPVVDYRGRTPTKVDDGIFLITARNIRNGRIDYDASEEYADPESAESLLARGRPEIGDLLFTMEAPLGQVALIDRTDIALAQRIVKFRGEPSVMRNHYLMFWFMSKNCQARLETLATGSTALGIKSSKLGMIECLAPTLNEQDAIISHVQRESERNDALVYEAENVIGLLQERRSALISAAVTGKIDVRGWQPPASAPSPELVQEAV